MMVGLRIVPPSARLGLGGWILVFRLKIGLFLENDSSEYWLPAWIVTVGVSNSQPPELLTAKVALMPIGRTNFGPVERKVLKPAVKIGLVTVQSTTSPSILSDHWNIHCS